MYEISSGVVRRPLKIVLYGPEGIGKSTFASRMPQPLLIDTEGSTTHMDVRRLPAPTSYTMLLDEIDYVKKNPQLCRTLVVDTADWAEQMAQKELLDKHQLSGIEDFGYGKGYVYSAEDFGKMLNKLTEVIESGNHVFVNAHAMMRKFEQPDEMGAYDRWELKLSKKCAPMLKEWADIVIFANYETYIVMEAGKDKAAKGKAQGGRRVMYTTHHPCWDAKNRFGLADKLPFDFAEIVHLVEDAQSGSGESGRFMNRPYDEDPTAQQESGASRTPQPAPKNLGTPQAGGASQLTHGTTDQIKDLGSLHTAPTMEAGAADDSEIPVELKQLMDAAGITAREVEDAVAKKGYYPAGMHICDYDPGFVYGCLIGAWDSVRRMIEENRI